MLNSQHPYSKMYVATKGVALDVCSPLSSCRLTLPLWSGKSQGILLFIFCGNHDLDARNETIVEIRTV